MKQNHHQPLPLTGPAFSEGHISSSTSNSAQQDTMRFIGSAFCVTSSYTPFCILFLCILFVVTAFNEEAIPGIGTR